MKGAIATAALLAAQPALAQEPPADSLLARWAEAPDDAVRRAVALLRGQETDAAVALLSPLVQQRGLDVGGYDAVAVLLRLANGRARPGAPTAGATPPGAPSPASADATPVASADAPPPPPSDERALARIIDGVVERLARWDEAGARSLLDAAADASSSPALAALRQVAGRSEARSEATAPPGFSYAATPLLPDRPAGTIEGVEVLTLYVAAGSYGFVLGTWAGLAVTDDRRNALRVALPLLGVSVGMVGALVLDRTRVVRRGRAYAFNTGLLLGSLAGTAAVLYARPDEAVSGWGLVLGGATLGAGLALGLSHAVDALPGSASYVASTGLWGSTIGLSLTYAFGGDRASREDIASGLLVGEGVGVILGLLTAGALTPTPAQTRWADVGAALGGMIGASLGAGAESTEGLGVGLAIGVLGGGALAWFLAAPSALERSAYLQRNAARELPLRFGVAPLPGGGMLHVGL